jgi:hypothetical protein
MEMNDFDSVEATHEELWLRRISESLSEGDDEILDRFGEFGDLDLPPPLYHLLCSNHTSRNNANAERIRNFSSSWAASIICNRSYPFLNYEQEVS